ncbi:hypothetical protein SLS54_008801 [Diplodia seriata]
MDPAKRDPDFKRMTDGAAWVHVLGFILCGFLLISMAILPVSATRRTFLNIILLVGIMLLELGFIIPLARQPEQCHNAITPNDMNTSTTCAFSGAFAAFGGMTLVTWILIRAFFMHLQIVWDMTPTKYHFLGANIGAWTVTIGLVSAVLAHAGVSFRFGGYCHVNHTGSIPTYWAWLLAFGGLAFVLQLLTFAYCIKVYLQAALLRAPTHALSGASSSDGTGTGTGTTTDHPAAARKNSAAAFSAQSRTRARAARAAARRVRQVLQLQWRSLAIVALAIFTTAFVCVVFIVLDNKQEKLALANTEASVPWITCMILTRDNERCLGETGPIVISQRITVATLTANGNIVINGYLDRLPEPIPPQGHNETTSTQWNECDGGCDGFDCSFAHDQKLPFTMVDEPAHGSYGLVKKIRSVVTGEFLVAKEIRWSSSQGQAKRGTILEELRMHRRLNHRHIAKVVGSYTKQGLGTTIFGIVITPLAQYDLRAFLEHIVWKRETNVSVLDDISLLSASFGCLASGLSYLHGQKVKHKDIKPGNILVHNDTILLTDFGLSKDFSDIGQSTSSGPTGYTRKVSNTLLPC